MTHYADVEINSKVTRYADVQIVVTVVFEDNGELSLKDQAMEAAQALVSDLPCNYIEVIGEVRETESSNA